MAGYFPIWSLGRNHHFRSMIVLTIYNIHIFNRGSLYNRLSHVCQTSLVPFKLWGSHWSNHSARADSGSLSKGGAETPDTRRNRLSDLVDGSERKVDPRTAVSSRLFQYQEWDPSTSLAVKTTMGLHSIEFLLLWPMIRSRSNHEKGFVNTRR